jgi:hypothetical protein
MIAMERQPHASTLSLLHGVFSPKEALDLLTQLVEVKIRFHEEKMKGLTEVEDLKMREKRIQTLQSELHALRASINPYEGAIKLTSMVQVQYE